MWTTYVQKREEIRKKRVNETLVPFSPPVVTDKVARQHEDMFEPLQSELNEVYLWHGTFVRTALSIAQKGFDIDLAGSSRGTMYGRGAYFAESSTKADEYARDEPDGFYAGIFALLLCRVCA